ncbi:hypothetical protein L9F63_009133, partial [Diploptera punctata]
RHFGISDMKRFENSKRFKYGSLLCFSKDDFKTIFLATVVNNDIDLLRNGTIIVEMCTGTMISESLFTDYYIMAESEVYFEPYYHVLKGLQSLKESTFPMKQYIVDMKCTNKHPQYLQTGKDIKYKVPRLRNLSDTSQQDGETFESKNDSSVHGGNVNTSSSENQHPTEDGCDNKLKKVKEFKVLDLQSWPSAKELGLDDSQYKAFQAALTREFVVIQGPPGTGKTFLGLKITEYLLKNASFWNKDQCPILIVCYTNHALDQFLEGLIPMTNSIVRIGGQSKNDSLKSFNLKSHRYSIPCTSLLKNTLRRKMEDLMRQFLEIEKDLKALSQNTGIVSLDSLVKVMKQEHYRAFIKNSPMDFIFDTWLMQGMFHDAFDEELKEINNDVELENVEVDNNEDLRNDPDIYIDGLDIEVGEVSTRLKMVLTLNNIEDEMSTLLKQQEGMNQVDYGLLQRLDFCQKRHAYLKYRLLRLGKVNKQLINRVKTHQDVWELNMEERWVLYGHWICQLKNELFKELERVHTKFTETTKKFEEVRHIEDLEILKNKLVVGLTTTGAARLQTLLQTLKPPIVIIEEAAEILEAHTVTAITSHCQHLILIGDHQQLKPSTGDFKLGRRYKYDLSLFERMVNNGMSCEVLKVQHRMRPEIVKLIVPNIYPELQNHPSVLEFPRILGVSNKLFFITHNIPDQQDPEIKSHRNEHEAGFMLELCKYLILQGYSADKITILTTYTGQMLYMRNEKKKSRLLDNVRTTVVDNFQGEENDIILLSLVRSNEEGNIGFLKTENRVCVALSRARHGLYIIGNMDDLSKSSDTWKNVKSSLDQQNAIRTSLTLSCEIHHDEKTDVSCARDFSKVQEGGCSLMCEVLLKCGHYCKSKCHVTDRQHASYLCPEPCNRTCLLNHPCKKKCWEKCGNCKVLVLRKLPCSHEKYFECYILYEVYKCQIVKVKRILPGCGHEAEAECCMMLDEINCPFPCEIRLPCGHKCLRECHVNSDPEHLEYVCKKSCPNNNAGCSNNHKCKLRCYETCEECSVLVEKTMPKCGHVNQIKCAIKVEDFSCTSKCTKELPCGHACPRKCGETCGGCQVKVSKEISECGHKHC